MKEQIEDIAKVIHDSDIADINTFPISMSECLGKHGARRTGAAIALVKAGYRKQSEWISVEDRMPESGVHCLLCCDLKRIDGSHSQYVCDGFHVERFSKQASGVDDDCVTEYNEEDDEYYISEGWYEIIKNWDDYGYIAIDDFVTHWMPLPEPPKMKGE